MSTASSCGLSGMISLLRPIHRFRDVGSWMFRTIELWLLGYEEPCALSTALSCGFSGVIPLLRRTLHSEMWVLSFKQLALRDEEPYTPWLHCGFHRMLVGKGHTRKWLIPAPGL
eukprot:scaffold94289_cov21-Tisochrysis_lutea.AAC.2